MKTKDFCSDAEVKILVAAFESGDLPAAEFKHSAHIAVALTYLSESPLPEATEHMRRSLESFIQHHNQTGYHETLTVFWMRLLDHLATVRHPEMPLWQRVNAVIASHGTKWPVEAHYSKELVSSPGARHAWVEPDLIPLPD
jgi:FPC/CPF motif-containing protein YcgG